MVRDHQVAVLVEEVELGLGEPWRGGWTGHAYGNFGCFDQAALSSSL